MPSTVGGISLPVRPRNFLANSSQLLNPLRSSLWVYGQLPRMALAAAFLKAKVSKQSSKQDGTCSGIPGVLLQRFRRAVQHQVLLHGFGRSALRLFAAACHERTAFKSKAARLDGMMVVPVQLALQLAFPCWREVHLSLSARLKHKDARANTVEHLQSAPWLLCIHAPIVPESPCLAHG